jgi:ADP-ribose pyrophosphatase YjhB (NUDIX family)
MEYIRWIRSKVGHDRVLIPATAVVILNSEEQVLLHLRDDSNTWGLPGGLMDIGETALESAAREVAEETGLKVKNLKLFAIFSGPCFEAKYPNGDKTSPVNMGFFTREYEGVPIETEEALAVGFFALHDLPQNMNPFHRNFVDGFIEFLRNDSGSPILR